MCLIRVCVHAAELNKYARAVWQGNVIFGNWPALCGVNAVIGSVVFNYNSKNFIYAAPLVHLKHSSQRV